MLLFIEFSCIYVSSLVVIIGSTVVFFLCTSIFILFHVERVFKQVQCETPLLYSEYEYESFFCQGLFIDFRLWI